MLPGCNTGSDTLPQLKQTTRSKTNHQIRNSHCKQNSLGGCWRRTSAHMIRPDLHGHPLKLRLAKRETRPRSCCYVSFLQLRFRCQFDRRAAAHQHTPEFRLAGRLGSPLRLAMSSRPSEFTSEKAARLHLCGSESSVRLRSKQGPWKSRICRRLVGRILQPQPNAW